MNGHWNVKRGFRVRWTGFSFLPLMILLLNSWHLSGQCVDTVDFREWIDAGHTGESWVVTAPNEVKEVQESIPPRPNLFISNKDYINIRFEFDVVSRNSNDQDFIGFVVGYKSPMSSGSETYEFILFDWKARPEVAFEKFADEGFHLSALHGNIPEDDIPQYFWGHNSLASDSRISPISNWLGPNTGWKTNITHHIQVTYTTGNIIVRVDGNLVFHSVRCNVPGRIGLYTYSQHNVLFSNGIIEQAAYARVTPSDICAGDSVFYTMEPEECNGINPSVETWDWNFGDRSTVKDFLSGYYIYDKPGEYQIRYTATFSGGCTDTLLWQVRVRAPVTVDLGPDTILWIHSDLTLTAGPDQYGWDYSWPDGSGLNRVTLRDLQRDTTVWVWVSRGLCTVYDEIHIQVETPEPQSEKVFVPNAFSPDGDGVNDRFHPVFREVLPTAYAMFIYNRWGQQIYESSDPEAGWDGTMNQVPSPADVYVYLIRYRLTDPPYPEINSFKKGTVMLVR